MDIGTISLVLVLGLIILLAIGMPLGFASAVMALVVLVMKFEPTLLTAPWCYFPGAECEGMRTMLTSRPGTGALYILTQKIFDLMTEYVLAFEMVGILLLVALIGAVYIAGKKRKEEHAS